MITKDRLNELALEVCESIPLEHKRYLPSYSQIFAHALIKRIEQEVEVVGHVEHSKYLGNGIGDLAQSVYMYCALDNGTKLIALPLVEGYTE